MKEHLCDFCAWKQELLGGGRREGRGGNKVGFGYPHSMAGQEAITQRPEAASL